jgi:hypothetical protein
MLVGGGRQRISPGPPGLVEVDGVTELLASRLADR